MEPKKATQHSAASNGAKSAPLPSGSAKVPAAAADAERSTSSPAPRAKRPASPYVHDIVTTAEGSKRLKMFVDLVRAAGLTDLLRSTGPFTVFAPTDRAFDRISQREMDALIAESARLTEILRHHIVAGRVKAPKPEAPGSATPIGGHDLKLTSKVDAYYVNEGRLVQTNIRASNGVIHAIDKLLVL